MMKSEDELSVWTMAYGAASAILLWRENLSPTDLDDQAAAHADAVLARLKAKERQLLPRKP